ncbi:P-loop NTPase [uncultured Erythrobacter sp.]|uniref:P-loop NTPase n=1 Tax=uncultured Erythrobacter sp. TaxID=263913 RepID=UPI002607B964|nr:P-loop NTPase [uncultured Erythrobacter sp.]
MTEQSKINRKGAKPGSLFERADQAFGLDRLGGASVPRNLPLARKPAARAKPQSAPASVAPSRVAASEQVDKPVAPQAAPEPTAEPAVTLRGPRLEIDRELLHDAGLIVPEDPVTGLLEEFRIVKRELLADARASSDPTARRILVCSPHPGEGKTYCATNLAIALAAERDVEVVLVDADLLNPSVARRLGIETGEGLMDALSDSRILPEDLVSPTDIDGLFIMQAGTSTSRDSENLTSTRTAEVLDRLTRSAPNRFVIFDTPPALAASPAAELAAYVGQALLVVRADQTGRAALEDARQLLSACPDIKLLLNAAQFSPSGRRFGDYGEREE